MQRIYKLPNGTEVIVSDKETTDQISFGLTSKEQSAYFMLRKDRGDLLEQTFAAIGEKVKATRNGAHRRN